MAAAAAAAVEKVVVMEERDSLSVSVLPSIDRREKVEGLYTPESTSGNIMVYTELSRSSSLLSSSHRQDVPEELKLASRNSSPIPISFLEGKQVRRRYGKMATGSSGYSKRSKMGQMEDLPMNEADANDVKEKSQIAKSKNGLNGKRVDRRNGKVSMKSKYDLFSLKAGMVTFNSGGGGNNSLGSHLEQYSLSMHKHSLTSKSYISGICGLKADAYDITKHLDEVSVKELLDGHCKGSSIAKDKGKKLANVSDNILNSVRKVCSILERKKPLRVQSSVEMDDTYAAAMNVDASNNGTENLTCITDLFSHGKVPPKVLDFPLCRPQDILLRVGLPPPMDLDALLVEAAKPVIYARDSFDSRGKQISHRASLANGDAIKFSTNKSASHSKWARIDNTAALFVGRTDFLAELECLKYDPNLVPVKSIKYLPSANQAAPCTSISVSVSDLCSSSSATCSRASRFSPEYGGNSKSEEDAGDSPRSLAAAQTLFDIAKQKTMQEKHQRMTWTSKPLDKAIKACRSKPDNKTGEIYSKPESVVSSHALVTNKESSSIFKKPRLLIDEKGKDHNPGPKGLVSWSIPRSNTTSSSRSYRDAHTNVKSYNSFMMPPPSSRVFDKASNNRQKLR